MKRFAQNMNSSAFLSLTIRGGFAETVQRYIDFVGATYPIWLDKSPFARPNASSISAENVTNRFTGIGLPTTYFNDRNEIIAGSEVGELNRAILQKRIPILVC